MSMLLHFSMCLYVWTVSVSVFSKHCILLFLTMHKLECRWVFFLFFQAYSYVSMPLPSFSLSPSLHQPTQPIQQLSQSVSPPVGKQTWPQQQNSTHQPTTWSLCILSLDTWGLTGMGNFSTTHTGHVNVSLPLPQEKWNSLVVVRENGNSREALCCEVLKGQWFLQAHTT